MSLSAAAAPDVAGMLMVELDTESMCTLVAALALEVGRTCGHVDRALVTRRQKTENWIGVYDIQVVGKDVAAYEQQP